MKWRVVVEVAGADGAVQSHEISVGGCGTIDSAEKPGLTLAEGKKTLAGNAIWFRRRRRSIAGTGDAASAAGLNVR